MIAYLDTSAVIALLIAEPSSAACRRIWDDADAVVSSRLTYAESAAALAQARRLKRLTSRTHRTSLRRLDELWVQLLVADIDQQLVESAAAFTDRFELRGYDAVHCASAEQLADDDVVAASGDQRLLGAWLRLGVSTYDTNQD